MGIVVKVFRTNCMNMTVENPHICLYLLKCTNDTIKPSKNEIKSDNLTK